MMRSEFWTVAGLGFLLGVRHAFDADHLAAVSTFVARRPSLKASGWIGLCWGMGHTAMLLAVGLGVVLLRVSIPTALADVFEFGIGMLLVGLGGSLAWTLYRQHWHWHAHDHDDGAHVHLHRHGPQGDHDHPHWLDGSLRPFAVGMAHGVAGSAALTLMVVSTARTEVEAVAYIAVFGLGSIMAMMALGILMSVPFRMSELAGHRARLLLQALASVASVAVGVAMMLKTAL
jgi:ABC-type nickel/cobalt efflux system permease component RcnA